MTWPIIFTEQYHYQTTRTGIQIPVSLGFQGNSVTLMAKVDTGARYCLFKREYGEQLGLDVDAGVLITLDSLGGPIEAFGHEVALQTFDLAYQSFVCFAKYPGLQRNLLGSVGWLRNLKLGVVDYDEMIYLAPYDSAS